MIDAFPHILPKRFFDRMFDHADGEPIYMRKRVSAIPVLFDLDERFRVMDRFGDYRQVLTIASPPIETLGPPAGDRGAGRARERRARRPLRPVCGSVPRVRGVGIAG